MFMFGTEVKDRGMFIGALQPLARRIFHSCILPLFPFQCMSMSIYFLVDFQRLSKNTIIYHPRPSTIQTPPLFHACS